MKAFIGLAQVEVGVEVEDAHAGVGFECFLNCTKRSAVVAADEADDFAIGDEGASGVSDPFVDLIGDEVHFFDELFLLFGIVRELSGFNGGGFGSFVEFENFFGSGEHGCALFPEIGEVGMEEVDLMAGASDGIGTFGGAAEIGGGGFKGDGDEDEFGVGGGVGKGVDAVAAGS